MQLRRSHRGSRWILTAQAALSAIVMAVVTACGAGTPAGQGGSGPLIWKAAWYVGEGQSTYDHGAVVFERTVEKKSGGDIQVKLYPSQQLGKVEDSLNMLNSGIADSAFTAPSYHVEQIPLLAAWNLPLNLSQEVIVEARWKAAHVDGPFVEQMHEAGLVPLFISATPNYEIMTTEQPLPSAAALAGLQLRVSGEILKQIVEALGGTGVIAPSSELFEMLDRGVLDGTVFHYGSLDSSGIAELISHGTANLQLPPVVVGSFVSQERWDRLTEKQQRILYEAARIASAEASEAILKEVENELPGHVDDGLTLHEWSKAKLDAAYERLSAIPKRWAKNIGPNGQAALEQVRKLTNEKKPDGSSDLINDFESFKF